jgi:hypothetical protein
MKSRCNNCNEKIKKSYSFCPNCGNPTKNKKSDWGMLGKNDIVENQFPKIVGGGLMGNMMNKMIGNAMKMLENEIAKEMSETNKQPRTKVKLMINGEEIISGENKKDLDKNTKILPIEFSRENLEKWKKLKKEEPKSSLKRVEDKIEYKIEVPEVKSIQDISIVKLENSLEVRAIGKEKGYKKNILIDLPLKKYSLLKGILTLEMDTEEQF